MNISLKSSLLLGVSASLCLLPCSATVSSSQVTQGFFNKNATTSMELIARYDAGELGLHGAVMEIITYNASNGHAYAVNGKTGQLVILAIHELSTASGAIQQIPARSFDIKSLVESRDSSFDYQDMTSVACSPSGKHIAIALQPTHYTDQGRVALFQCAADGSLALQEVYTVGMQPDMVCFADENTLLTANEGEPREGYGTGASDPAGGASIIRIAEKSVTEVDFTRLDSAEARASLVASGVILKKGALPSLDLEPEYITVSQGKAYIALQEANAIAVLDLASSSITQILPLGYSDYTETSIDLNSKDKKPLFTTHAGLYGARMPDAISSCQIDGHTYIVTANEGDGRDWGKKDGKYENEIKVKLKDTKSSPAGSIRAEQWSGDKRGKITLLDTSQVDGLDASKDYLLGSRSFSIYQITPSGLSLVFDSGSQFEHTIASTLGEYYPLSGDGLGLDDRSGKKGPEPECVVLGEVSGRLFAFIGLERTGGIMVYDMSQPAQSQFVNYINTRDFGRITLEKSADGDEVKITDGDISPEGLAFVPAGGGKPAMLLVANEISGTVAVIKIGEPQP